MPTTLEQIQYGFDRNSRRMWQRRALSTTQDQHYNYDALSQVNAAARGSLNLNMTAISGVPVSAESWDYDPTGNWRGYHSATNGTPTLDQHRVHDRGNRLTQIEDNPHNMILDRVGRMRQMAPDASGDWDGKLEITWDAWSRITSVKNNGAVVGEYSYDGTHRRITREVAGETLHSYYNEEWRPVEERKDAESTAALSYLWGARHRDDLVRRDRAVGGTTLNESRYLLMDYFNPAAITDADGTVKERYAFSAFGVRTILNPDFTTRNSSECDFVFGFQGQFLDQESGLMNYGYRYYVSYLGRWSSKDPIEEKGGVNLYGMVGNGPLNRIDYLGLISGPFGDCCEPGTKRKAKYKKDYLSIDGMDPSDVDESRKDAEDTLSTRPWNRNPYDAGTKGAARAAVGGYFDHLQSIAQKMQDLKNDIGGYLWVIIDYEKCERKMLLWTEWHPAKPPYKHKCGSKRFRNFGEVDWFLDLLPCISAAEEAAVKK